MKQAVIDIGSNSLRLMTAEKINGAYRCAPKELCTTRLGTGVRETGRLDPYCRDKSLQVLKEWKGRLGACSVIAFATSAVREALDGRDFVERVRELTGWQVQVLSGEEEARYGYIGAVGNTGAGLMVDIGGGSTEAAAGWDGAITWSCSYPLGAVRMALSEPILPERLGVLKQECLDILAENTIPEMGNVRAVGVGGTITSAASILLGLREYDTEKINGYELTKERIAALAKRLAAMPEKERRTVAGLQPERSPIIVSGLLILESVMERFGLDSICVSEQDGMEGILLAGTFLSAPD